MNKSHIRPFVLFTLILSVSIFSLFDSDNPLKLLHQHFHNCEYEKAITVAEILLRNSEVNIQNKSQIYIIKGVSEFSLNQLLNSRITFTELLLIDENVVLDSKLISPKIIKFFNELKKSHKKLQ